MARKSKKIEYIKQNFADDAILAATDRMAFTQDELIDLLDKGITEVYFLCVQFVVPEGVERISCRSANHPVVKFNIIEGIEKAAEQGHAKAQYKCGQMYEAGEGTRKDWDKARMWYQKAKDQGEYGRLK